MVPGMDTNRPGLGEAALSLLIQLQGLTATRQHDSQEPFAARPWVPPQRRRSHDKIYSDVFQHQRRQGAVRDQDCDVDLMGKQLELTGPDREEPLSVNPGKLR